MLLSVFKSTAKATNLNLTLCGQIGLNYIRTVICHEAHCSGRNRVGAVLRIPSCLLPSDSSSLAGPQSSVWTVLWGSSEGCTSSHEWTRGGVSTLVGKVTQSACLFPGSTRVLCKQQLCSTDCSCRIVIGAFFLERDICLEMLFLVSYTDTKCHNKSKIQAKMIRLLTEH